MRKGIGFCIYEKRREEFILRSFTVSVDNEFITLFYPDEDQFYPTFKDMTSMLNYLLSLAQNNVIEIPYYCDFNAEVYSILFFKTGMQLRKENYIPCQYFRFRD